jgi:hypothetical protein
MRVVYLKGGLSPARLHAELAAFLRPGLVGHNLAEAARMLKHPHHHQLVSHYRSVSRYAALKFHHNEGEKYLGVGRYKTATEPVGRYVE